MKPLLLVVDDHPLYRYGLTRALATSFDLIEAESIQSAVDALTRHSLVALVLLDLRLPDAVGLSGLEVLTRQFRDVPRVALSGDDDPALPDRVRAAGASGFVHKSVGIQSLVGALLGVLAGESVFLSAPTRSVRPARPSSVGDSGARARSTLSTADLSLRELEVLSMASRGLTNKEIGNRLTITERTVKAHLSAAFIFLGAKTRTEAAFLASQLGLLVPA